MPVLIALLRGVNVGGKNKIKMDALRDLCESLKFRDACTHLQSGNLVFRSASESGAAAKLEKAIEREFGIHSSVIVRTPEELAGVIARNPFADRGLDPSKLLVYFLSGEPSPEARAKLSQIQCAPDELHVHARELFAYFPNGMGRPKLSMAAVDRALKIPGTGRNWNTVSKLLEIATAMK
jgi:uncharacterized protein (DUF1697 family)